MNAALLLLADGRFPSGGHADSGGAEPAVGVGDITDLGSLREFVSGRLHTTGLVDAAFAAAVCARCLAGVVSAATWGELEACLLYTSDAADE